MCEQPVKPTMLMLFITLLLFSIGVGNIHCSKLQDNNTDMLSLLDFRKAIINDPAGILNSWNTSTPFCKWKGVSCSLKHPERVTVLDLRDRSLSGKISPSIGNLTFLKALNLSANRFSGELPPFNRLGKLQYLSLTDNLLEGNIPDGLTNCSNLLVLALSGNMLVGEIPPKISSLSNLKMLGLNLNTLSGVIPPFLNETDLEFLSFSDNQLEGGIPEEFGQLPKLQILQLGVNMMSGPIPSSLFNLSSLEILDLDSNNLGGALPSNAGQVLPTLKMLFLGKNIIEGKIPTSLGNASRLMRIDLSFNRFIGPIPDSLGRLSNLSHLNLQNNKLEAKGAHSWKFLDTLSNCRHMNILSLYNNELQGVIPSYIGNLSTSLQQLVLGQNNLSGTVPPSIANLSGLTALELGSNNFTGTLEEWIGSMKELQILNFHANNLIGRIPSSIGNLNLLSSISLAENKFEGIIPQSLGNLRRLSNLELSDNNLQGNIPIELSNLTQLTQLRLSRNKLTGEIPHDLGQCQELTIIEMDQNFLTGNIPISLSNLLSLSTLNLSHNNLSGVIPVGLGNLSVLTQLDLSFNHLQGQVPTNGVFENATAVSLNGNWDLCGGIHELHMPSCDSVPRTANKLYYLVRVLVPIFGAMSLLTAIYFILVSRNIPIKLYFSPTSSGDEFLKVSYTDLAKATGNFSNMIGRGSYGTVYKGQLTKIEFDVAVKVFDLEMQGAEKSFLLECAALKSTRHRNLLPIVTTCSTVDTRGNPFKALIYEFMPRGNLDTWLHYRGDGNETVTARDFGLAKRLSIAVNVADALDYLHNGTERSIIHCDLKPTNILLDNNMIARLGDFGISSVFDNSRSTPVGESCSYGSIIPKGTIGYIAPEYAGARHASTYGDVYSFGVVLLEMLTGKRPTDPIFKDGLNVVNFVEMSFPDHILQVIDAHIQEECKNLTQAMAGIENVTLQCLMSLLQVALSCTRQLPVERMHMKDVATKMHAIKATYEDGKARIVSI